VEAFVADRLRVSAEGTFLANYNFVPASRAGQTGEPDCFARRGGEGVAARAGAGGTKCWTQAASELPVRLTGVHSNGPLNPRGVLARRT
jgi:hypothetical protein